MKTFAIAIVDPNMLTSIGLQQMLRQVIPFADIRIFPTFDALLAVDSDDIVHCFVSSRIYFEHTQFFRERHKRTIVMVAGDMQVNGVITLNVCQSEQQLAGAILRLHHLGHPHQHHSVEGAPTAVAAAHTALAAMHSQMLPEAAPETIGSNSRNLLSTREIEVARLLSKGCINKEVADSLNISVTTVNTHRKNIMEKLHARSLADIIIYTVMNGFVDIGEL